MLPPLCLISEKSNIWRLEKVRSCTKLAKKVCPRLRELALRPAVDSRDVTQTFLAIFVCSLFGSAKYASVIKTHWVDTGT